MKQEKVRRWAHLKLRGVRALHQIYLTRQLHQREKLAGLR